MLSLTFCLLTVDLVVVFVTWRHFVAGKMFRFVDMHGKVSDKQFDMIMCFCPSLGLGVKIMLILLSLGMLAG